MEIVGYDGKIKLMEMIYMEVIFRIFFFLVFMSFWLYVKIIYMLW